LGAEIKGISPVGQQTAYSCGIGALETIFKYYGKKIGGNLKYISERGMNHGKLIDVAGKNNFAVHDWTGDLTAVKSFVSDGIPVIVNYQDYGANNGENGHYAVVVGYGIKGLKIADPAEGGKIRWIKTSWFRERWRDPDAPKGERNEWACILIPRE